MRQAKERQKRTKDTQGTRHVKRILALADLVRGVLDNHGEDVCAHERANFSHGGCGAIVLTADGRRAGLGCTETDVVAGADFAHGEEDTVIRVVSAKWDKWGLGMNSPVDNDKGGHVVRRIQVRIASGHDQTNGSLDEHAEC